MSGGFFNYNEFWIEHSAESVRKLIEHNNDDGSNEFEENCKFIRGYDQSVISEFVNGYFYLRMAYIYLTRIDYLVSGDDGPESFVERLNKQASDFDNEFCELKGWIEDGKN